MNKLVPWIVALITLCSHPLLGHDLSGQWQGTLPVEGGLRMILKVTQAADGKLSATYASIDQAPQESPVASVSLEGSTFRFSFDHAADRYEGTLSEDGTTISGRWYGARHPGTFYPMDWHLATGADKWGQDSSPHKVQFVTVDNGVKLEVLDWGGPGRPLVLLAGLGNDAHIFDKMAPKLAAIYHVYGITRRGFGASGAPEPVGGNYSVNRLGDDVLEVMATLKIDRPVLVGHSIAGQELSSIGSRHPEKVAGLIYLDAAYPYAFYDPAHGDLVLDSNEAEGKLARLKSFPNLPDRKRLVQELLKNDLPRLEKSLAQYQQELDAEPGTASPEPSPADTLSTRIDRAILEGEQKYAATRCPVLAIYAITPVPGPDAKADPTSPSDALREWQATQIRAFEAGVPSAHVVLIPDAQHHVFLSNEAEVLREMNGFLSKLP